MANQGDVVGKVVKLDGQVIVRSYDGKEHVLKLGELIFANDVIITGKMAM